MKKTFTRISLLVILGLCTVLLVLQFDKPIKLSLPHGLYGANAYIDGPSWGTRIYSDQGIEGELVCCEKEDYEKLWQSNYKNVQLHVDGAPDCPAVWEPLPEDQNSKDAEVLQYSFQVGSYKTKPKLIRYEIDKGTSVLFILEEYAIKEDHGIIMGDSVEVPVKVSFWGVEGDICFYGYLKNFETRPDAQWLAQIGVQRGLPLGYFDPASACASADLCSFGGD